MNRNRIVMEEFGKAVFNGMNDDQIEKGGRKNWEEKGEGKS